MMRSLFYEKQLVNEDFSILRFIKGAGGDSRNQSQIMEVSQSEVTLEEDTAFEEVMSKAQTSKSFKEFYRQNLSELKYEILMH